MSYLIKPAGYKALLNLSQTEMGIKKIKDFFQQNLSSELRLRRVTAPLFVLKGMGINDKHKTSLASHIVSNKNCIESSFCCLIENFICF